MNSIWICFTYNLWNVIIQVVCVVILNFSSSLLPFVLQWTCLAFLGAQLLEFSCIWESETCVLGTWWYLAREGLMRERSVGCSLFWDLFYWRTGVSRHLNRVVPVPTAQSSAWSWLYSYSLYLNFPVWRERECYNKLMCSEKKNK